MSFRPIVSSVALALAVNVLPAIALANTEGGYVEVNAAPPPPRQEAVPEKRNGYFWGSGYWGWSGSQHVWVNGQYVPERLHHHWVAANWEQRGSHWYFQDGRWESDDGPTSD
jgi:hypothetical protein